MRSPKYFELENLRQPLEPSVVAARDARRFCSDVPVLKCGLLSGLWIRHFEKPLAGMVICG